MSFRVLHAPLYGPGAGNNPEVLKAHIVNLHPDATTFTEAYPKPVRQALRSIDGQRLIQEDGGIDQRRGQYDVPMLVRSSLRSFGSGQLFGAEASTPERLAPERWMTFAAFEAPGLGTVATIGLHPHAAVQSKATGRLRVDIARGREFEEQMRRFDALLTFVKAMGWTPVVAGDINFRNRGDSFWSPYRVLRDQGLQIHDRGIDLIAAPKGLLKVSEAPVPKTITNHPWLLGVAA